jgi:hypothetical protein
LNSLGRAQLPKHSLLREFDTKHKVVVDCRWPTLSAHHRTRHGHRTKANRLQRPEKQSVHFIASAAATVRVLHMNQMRCRMASIIPLGEVGFPRYNADASYICQFRLERLEDIVANPILGGLHHRYARNVTFRKRQVWGSRDGVRALPECICIPSTRGYNFREGHFGTSR